MACPGFVRERSDSIRFSRSRTFGVTVAVTPPLEPFFIFGRQPATQNKKMATCRPIPYNTTETLFWTCVGDAPEWFVYDDDEPVASKLFSSIELATEWMRRRQENGLDIPRVIARGENGSLYWLTKDGVRVVLNAFGNPDFSADQPAYE
jgi:hypothetical protein